MKDSSRIACTTLFFNIPVSEVGTGPSILTPALAKRYSRVPTYTCSGKNSIIHVLLKLWSPVCPALGKGYWVQTRWWINNQSWTLRTGFESIDEEGTLAQNPKTIESCRPDFIQHREEVISTQLGKLFPHALGVAITPHSITQTAQPLN